MDVLNREVRKVANDLILRHSRSKVFEYVAYSDAKPPNTRLSAAFIRFERYHTAIVHVLKI